RLFSSAPRPLPSSTLFPYTTLFRSLRRGVLAGLVPRGEVEGPRAPDAARARPVVRRAVEREEAIHARDVREPAVRVPRDRRAVRSEEHTSELQSRENLVCRLLLEKK